MRQLMNLRQKDGFINKVRAAEIKLKKRLSVNSAMSISQGAVRK